MRLNSYILFINILIIFSCAVNKPTKTAQVVGTIATDDFYLPGVDSTVARNATQFSDRIIVDFDRRRLAEQWYNKGKNSFNVADSLVDIFQHENLGDSVGLRLYADWRQTIAADQIDTKTPPEIETYKPEMLCLAVLDSAYNEISRAKALNPYDLNIRSLLIKIYLKQGEISSDKLYYKDAIEELYNFLLVDKSNPYIYEKLAECYYVLQDWEHCYQFFHKAEQILHIVSKFKHDTNQIQDTPVDTARLVYYLRKQGEAKAKLYDAKNALYYLAEAKQLSTSQAARQDLQNIIDWINWDAGNIRASEIKDKILEVEKSHDYRKARGDYVALLKLLTTPKAKNEISWKIASIDYNFLNRKNEALKRLFPVIQKIKKVNSGQPLHTIYLKDYAAMCYAVGMEHFSENRFRLAYIYLNQAAQFDWEHKADCFYQLAILSDENPEETIKNCNEALKYSNSLSRDLLENIYEMLAVSYKRKGEFDMANSYFQHSVNK